MTPDDSDDTSDRPEFSVYQFFTSGRNERTAHFVKAEVAMSIATMLMASLGAHLGTTTRIIITDGGDCCCFEWEFGKGVVFPKDETQEDKT